MGKPATRAKDKYNEKSYDRFTLRLAKGEKDRLQTVAEPESLNSWILDAISRKESQKHV